MGQQKLFASRGRKYCQLLEGNGSVDLYIARFSKHKINRDVRKFSAFFSVVSHPFFWEHHHVRSIAAIFFFRLLVDYLINPSNIILKVR